MIYKYIILFIEDMCQDLER